MCLEFNRLDGDASLTVWYRAGQVWEHLRHGADWIDMGPSTPNFDASGDGRSVERLITAIETSAMFEVALAQPTLALVLADDVVFPARRAPG